MWPQSGYRQWYSEGNEGIGVLNKMSANAENCQRCRVERQCFPLSAPTKRVVSYLSLRSFMYLEELTGAV